MFNIMKEYHQKFNKLNNLKTRTKDNEKRKQEVLTNVGNIYNELYDIYKSKQNKKIYSLNAKNKKNLDYIKLRFSDNYLYSSEEKQKEEQEEKQEEEQKKQDEKTIDMNEFNEQINKKETDINKELFKKHFNFQGPSNMYKLLTQQKIKQKAINQ